MVAQSFLRIRYRGHHMEMEDPPKWTRIVQKWLTCVFTLSTPSSESQHCQRAYQITCAGVFFLFYYVQCCPLLPFLSLWPSLLNG